MVMVVNDIFEPNLLFYLLPLKTSFLNLLLIMTLLVAMNTIIYANIMVNS